MRRSSVQFRVRALLFLFLFNSLLYACVPVRFVVSRNLACELFSVKLRDVRADPARPTKPFILASKSRKSGSKTPSHVFDNARNPLGAKVVSKFYFLFKLRRIFIFTLSIRSKSLANTRTYRLSIKFLIISNCEPNNRQGDGYYNAGFNPLSCQCYLDVCKTGALKFES